MPVSSFGRMPRAQFDPIVCVDDARAVFALQMTEPVQDETLVMLLDDRLCGSTLMTVTRTGSVAQLLDVAEAMGMIASTTPGIAAVVFASVRSAGMTGDLLDAGIWRQLDEIVDGFGVVLLEWLVTGPWGVLLPRAIHGVPSRWPADA